MTEMTRRAALGLGALSATGLPASFLMPAAASASTPLVNLDDPEEAFRAKIKTLGSLADEEVFRLSTGHIYGFVPGKPVFPMMNIENYSVSRWQRLPEGDYRFTMWEIGVHTDRETGEPLQTYRNPVTEKVVDVIPYAVGPLEVTITPQGILTPGTERTVQPESLKPRVFDGFIWYPFESPVTLPNPLSPDDWPEASAGEFFSWHTVLVFVADLEDVADPRTSWAPAHSNYMEFLSWQPWLHMGQTPGGMLTRGYGKKFGPEEAMPAEIRRKIEARVPEIFDRNNWTQRRNEFSDYIEYRRQRERRESDG